MSRFDKDYLNGLTATYERPVQPEPHTFRWDHPLDWEWRRMYERDPKGAVRLLRGEAAHELTKYIMDRCQFFGADWRPEGPMARIEITLHDRGTYANLIPDARREEAHQERERTTKRLTESLPYGLAEAARDFYEID